MNKLTIDEIIEHCKRKTARYEQLNGIKTLENSDISNNFIKEYWEHRQVAEYLEELRQYRAIGKVEEIKRMQRYSALAKKHSTIGQVIDSCAEYEAIGTVEECW